MEEYRNYIQDKVDVFNKLMDKEDSFLKVYFNEEYVQMFVCFLDSEGNTIHSNTAKTSNADKKESVIELMSDLFVFGCIIDAKRIKQILL